MFPPWNWGYTAILNVMEVPVTQVPLGLNDAGVPLGVQVVGVHGNDHLTIGVALELEKAFGGWVPPPLARADGADGKRAGVPRRRAEPHARARDGTAETA
jgi:fatty acid amide hydrolase 2